MRSEYAIGGISRKDWRRN